MTVASHNNRMFEFIVNGFLGFIDFWDFSSKSLSFVRKSDHLLIDQLETVVDGKIFADVVDNQVDSTLEDPRRGEEPGPGLNGVIEYLGLRRHEKARISSDLAKF